MTLDPIRLAIIRNALVTCAEEMSITVWRTSRSAVVREILDYSTCVFDAQGRSIAQAARMPVHLNAMGSCLTAILTDHIPLAHWTDGDIIMTNDPYCGGQHLPDIQTFMPVVVDEVIVGIVGVLVHHLDVGGGAPGSYYAQATEIYQEGLRIPPLKVVAAGQPNEAVIQLLRQNSREPTKIGGDFSSQLAALRIGAESLRRLHRRYGSDLLHDAGQAIQAQSAATLRAAIQAVPDGVYDYADQVDDDGINHAPLTIQVRLTVAGEHLSVDLSGSSPQAAGPVNCTLNMTSSAVLCGVLMAIGGDIPANDGCFRAIDLHAPQGSVVNANPPAPVANRMAVGHRIVNAVVGAFGVALPGQIAAAYYGVSYVYALNAIHADGRRQVYFDLECGGWGAHPEVDGANGLSCGLHNLANAPVEMLEADYPITFLRYGLLPDSGGAGRTRGGLGLVREWRLDAPQGGVAANLDRCRIPPPGSAGGGPGRCGRLLKRRGHEIESLTSKVSDIPLQAGDIITLETSGGGGYGNPAERDRAAVQADIENGYISIEAAQTLYHWQD